MSHIGTRIREARENAGLSQQALATQAGIAIRTLGNIESGLDMRVSSLKAIADGLGIPVAQLLEENGRKRKRAS